MTKLILQMPRIQGTQRSTNVNLPWDPAQPPSDVARLGTMGVQATAANREPRRLQRKRPQADEVRRACRLACPVWPWRTAAGLSGRLRSRRAMRFYSEEWLRNTTCQNRDAVTVRDAGGGGRQRRNRAASKNGSPNSGESGADRPWADLNFGQARAGRGGEVCAVERPRRPARLQRARPDDAGSGVAKRAIVRVRSD